MTVIAVTLIVSHNTRDDLRACLRSLLDSGAPPESVFVADNASTDGTRELLQQEFPLVPAVFHDRNLLYAEAVNGLVAGTESDWMLLLNPDVVCRYDELQALCARWEDHRRVAAVAPQLRFFDGRIQPTCRRLPDAWTAWREAWCALRRRPSTWKMADFDHRSTRAVPQPMFSCLWIRRSAWADTGDLDPRYPLYFNDVDWCRRALARDHELQFDPSVAVLHKRGGTTAWYPLRKHYHSHRSFAAYLWSLNEPVGARILGEAGILLACVVQWPGALLQWLGRARGALH